MYISNNTMVGQSIGKNSVVKANPPTKWLTKWRTKRRTTPLNKRFVNTAPHPPNEAFSVVDNGNNIIFGVGPGVITDNRPDAVVLLQITPSVDGETRETEYLVDYTFMNDVDETMQEHLVQKTVKTMLKFGFFNNGDPSYHIVTLDKPISRANGKAQWHQDSLNLSFLQPDIKQKFQPKFGLIKCDYIVVQYLNDGLSTCVTYGLPPDNSVHRVCTEHGTELVIKNDSTYHSAPMRMSNDDIDRTAGNKLLDKIIKDKLERTLHRTQILTLTEGYYNSTKEYYSNIAAPQNNSVFGSIFGFNPSVTKQLIVENVIPYPRVNREYARPYEAGGSNTHNRRTKRTTRKRPKRTQKKRNGRKMRIKAK